MSIRTILMALVVLAVLGIGAYAMYQRSARGLGEPRVFRLNEFGVEITVPGELDDLAYTVQPDGASGTVLHVRSDNAHNINGSACELGVFTKIPKTGIPKNALWNAARLEAAEVGTDDQPAQVQEFTDFYLLFEPSQTVCAQNERNTEHEARNRLELWRSLTTARYIKF